MDELEKALAELNIEKETFDKIVSDEGTRKKITECLLHCMKNVPVLRQTAALLLKYITLRRDADDTKWITVKGTHIPLDDEGNLTGRVAEKIKDTSKKVRNHVTEASAPLSDDDFEKEGFHKSAEGHWEKTAGIGKTLTDRVKKAAQNHGPEGQYTSVARESRKCFTEMPIGTKVKMKYGTFTKTGDNEFKEENGRTSNLNMMVNSVYPNDEASYPEFIDSDKNAAAAKQPTKEPAAVAKPAKEYSGKTDFKHGSVSKEAAQKRFAECAKNAEKAGKELTSEDFEGMLSSVKDYNFGDECKKILAAQADPDKPTHASWLFSAKNDAERKAYEKKGEQIERMIELSDKMTKPAYRGIGLNSSLMSEEDLKNVLGKLKPGADISFGHLSSWTGNRGTASSYASSATDMDLEDGENYSILYELKKPKSLASMSSIMPEGECLAPKKAKFRVASVKHKYDEDLREHSYVVEVEEV